MGDEGFVKIYGSILGSSVWGESLATRIVWITMLAMSDRNGLVQASCDGVARYANISEKSANEAISVLSSPDSRSKSKKFEGRRIKKVEGGYQILNYKRYRKLQTRKQKADAERQRRHRVTKRDVTVTSHNVTPPSRPVAPKAKAKAEAKAETTTTKTTTPDSHESDTAKPVSRSWVDEGVRWWVDTVGGITHARFGAGLSDAVTRHGWEKVFAALKCYVSDAVQRGKPARVEWCAAEIVRWVEWAAMPATDENGDLTARGKAIMGIVA